MNTLDEETIIEKLDPSHVLDSIGLFPKQCGQAWNDASKVVFPEDYTHVENIVVCGMGGSRFTPKTVKELFSDRIAIPYEIIDDYHVPAYVNEKTLVVLSSYSGTTEEVLSCAQEAIAKKAKIAGMAKGGQVIEFLKQYSFPYYQFNEDFNPCKQPRVGGGYLLFGHMAFLHTLGFLSLSKEEVETAITYASKCSEQYLVSIEESNNYAKQLARVLKDKHVFLIAAEFLRGFVNGFANQINETAKMISDYRYIPELNHHLMEGLQKPDLLHENGLFVFFESNAYTPKIMKRFHITQDIVEKQNVATQTIYLKGPSKLSQVLEGFMMSGYTTFYLGMLYEFNPATVPWVDYFKQELAKK